MDEAKFDKFVLANMPSFIAINYQWFLETQNPEEQVALLLHIYNLGLRALTINLVSQYLFRDRAYVNDPSNFLLALAQELQTRSNICVLMYDGANIPPGSSSLTELISRDFSDQVLLSGKRVEHVWHEISKIDGIEEHQTSWFMGD